MTATVLRCDYCRRRFSDKRGCEYLDEDERGAPATASAPAVSSTSLSPW